MAMKLNPLRIFLSIVDTGSQHAAARSLGLTQPAVTKALQRLEAELDVRLFDRSVHGASLTEYGQTLLSHARLIDSELKTCVDTLEQIKGARKGSVSVALSHLPGTLLLPDALKRFRRTWSDVNLRIAASAYPFLLPQIREGALDFAIAPAPLQDWPEDLLREPLMSTRLSPIVRRSHEKATATRLTDLAGAEWVLPTQESATAQALHAAASRLGMDRPLCQVTCETFTAMIMTVAASDLVGLIPIEMVASIATFAGVVEVPIEDQLEAAELCLIRRRAHVLTPAAAAFATAFRAAATRLSDASDFTHDN
ncbi:LysR substrate-binding domain-containing protein [Martelella sp. FLE1502]